jgi:5-formyltetrahydrofolate cyclo-ligase
MLTTELKNSIRITEKQKRAAISAEQKAAFDKAIFENIIALDEYIKSNVILTYVSFKGEPDTLQLIQYSISSGKTVAVPLCIPNTGMLAFYVITNLNQLRAGSFGLLEPDRIQCEKLSSTANGLCIVPALSFDIYGNRIGYGKGYYDRFLQNFKGYKAGICFSLSMKSKKLPCENFDIPCDAVITENNTYFVNY